MTPAAPQSATVALPPWLPTRAVIQDIRLETPGVKTYSLSLPSPLSSDAYTFEPGQFNMLYLPGWGEVAISLSGPTRRAAQGGQNANHLIHTIRAAGSVTRAIAALGVGDQLALRGPFGKPWPLDHLAGADVVLVAGGIGLAPLRPVIYELLADRERYGKCLLLYGARSPETMLYARDFAAWGSAGLQIQTTVDRAAAGWNGHVGVVPLLIDRLQLNASRTAFLMCGPEVMMRHSALSAISAGVARQRVWVSLERHMQCAVGLCGHCQLGTELLCRDGPVFRWDHVEPLLQIHDL